MKYCISIMLYNTHCKPKIMRQLVHVSDTWNHFSLYIFFFCLMDTWLYTYWWDSTVINLIFTAWFQQNLSEFNFRFSLCFHKPRAIDLLNKLFTKLCSFMPTKSFVLQLSLYYYLFFLLFLPKKLSHLCFWRMLMQESPLIMQWE